ncbi:MAG: DNA-binding response regulator [Candidatus Cloacimonetes bacterium HGW-Cloacimonetes-3]|jgi:two-component system nitrogen regulation response regulator NtrX|nr:MAG: DNA-binding response regulator [Candidatus Cloacimonetes bacterium HGW-Cloacimonetes-3]
MKVLIIDDEKNICLTVSNILNDEGYEVDSCYTAKCGLSMAEDGDPDVILLDVKLPDMNGIDVLAKLKKSQPGTPVLMISGNSGIADAVKAIKLGAFDFLEKPLSLPKVKLAISKALEFSQLAKELQRIRSENELNWEMIGNSSAIQDLNAIIDRIAPSNAKVLIQGESGTGKELVARLIHARSPRLGKPFIKFNSAAIPRELVESELFGYERGAFTGAQNRKRGKLEEADGGSLFLDEIGDMEPAAQAKILRVIQEGEFERVGGNLTHHIDVRIIAATNKDLATMVNNGSFREDLFYRLNVVPVFTPPLRKRKEDIPLLVRHFSVMVAAELSMRPKEFSPKALEFLAKPDYPGNVRELKNIIERIYLLCDKQLPEPFDLANMLPNAEINADMAEFWKATAAYADKKRDFEIRYLSTQLQLFGGSVSRTAEALGLQQSNLSRKLQELGIK